MKLIDVAPAAGSRCSVPRSVHPVVEAFGVGATTIAPGVVGRVSVKCELRHVECDASLLIVNVSVETPPGRIEVGENALVNPGVTVNVAVAGRAGGV